MTFFERLAKENKYVQNDLKKKLTKLENKLNGEGQLKD